MEPLGNRNNKAYGWNVTSLRVGRELLALPVVVSSELESACCASIGGVFLKLVTFAYGWVLYFESEPEI